MPSALDIFRLMDRGEGLADADITALRLPALDTVSTGVSPTGIAASSYARHMPGVFKVARCVIGLPANDQAGSVQKPTLTVTDDSGSSHLAIPIFNFPKGVVQVLGCYADIGLTTGGGTWTTPHYSVAIGSGTAGACTSSTLTGAFANLIASKNFTDGTGTLTVSESLLGSGAITDSTGHSGSATSTWLTVAATTTTDLGHVGDALSQIATVLNNFSNTKIITIDGSGTAAVLYLNLGVASSPSTLTAILTANSVIEVTYRMLSPQAYANTATTIANAVRPNYT